MRRRIAALMTQALFEALEHFEVLEGYEVMWVDSAASGGNIAEGLSGCHGLLVESLSLLSKPRISADAFAEGLGLPVGLIGEEPDDREPHNRFAVTAIASEDHLATWLQTVENFAVSQGCQGGSVVVVIGAYGAPGRTRLALALAEQASVSGHPTVVIDADHDATGLSFLLGLEGRVSGLKNALQSARVEDVSSDVLLGHCEAVTLKGHKVMVLTGFGDGDAHRAFGPDPYIRLMRALRSAGYRVIIDTAGVPRQSGGIGGKSAEWREKLLVEHFVAEADRVVAVVEPSELGLTRFLRVWHQMLAQLESSALAVFVPRQHVVSRSHEETHRTLWEYTGLREVFFPPQSQKTDREEPSASRLPSKLVTHLWGDKQELRMPKSATRIPYADGWRALVQSRRRAKELP